jgi:hypothetical protein
MGSLRAGGGDRDLQVMRGREVRPFFRRAVTIDCQLDGADPGNRKCRDKVVDCIGQSDADGVAPANTERRQLSCRLADH